LFDSASPSAKVKKIPSNSSRFGDLDVDDFGSPNRAQKNFPVVQATITSLKNKNKCLLEKNRRLESKVKTLECIINDLHSKSLISDAGANNLKVYKFLFINCLCKIFV